MKFGFWMSHLLISLYQVMGVITLTPFGNASSKSTGPANCGDIIPGCVKCELTNTTEYVCLKCSQLIVVKTRKCVNSCPAGYTESWSTMVDYMGRVCKEGVLISGVSLTGQKFAMALGAIFGAMICLLMMVCAALYLRYRMRKGKGSQEAINRQSPSLSHLTGTHRSQADSDDSERPEFVKQLGFLRGDATVFLAMLNETRRQVRELRKPSRQNSALQAYRPVLKDLSRILILLNKPEEKLGVPPADWETLLAWGERVLRRYKQQNPDQVARLFGVSRSSLEYDDDDDSDSPITSYQHSLFTFPKGNASSANHIHNDPVTDHTHTIAITTYNENAYSCNGNARRGFEPKRHSRRPASLLAIGSDRETFDSPNAHSTILAEWSNPSRSGNHLGNVYSAADDDDFYTLGFRPQDEITTEL